MIYRKKCGIRSFKKAPCDSSDDDDYYICMNCKLKYDKDIKNKQGNRRRKCNSKKGKHLAT